MVVSVRNVPASSHAFVAEVAAATAIANLATALINAGKAGRKAPQKLAAKHIVSLIASTLRSTADQLVNEVVSFESSLKNRRINTNRPIAEIDQDWGFWTGSRYRAYRKCTDRLIGIAHELARLHSELVVIAGNNGRRKLARESEATLVPKSDERHARVRSGETLSAILIYLRKEIGDMARQLSQL